MWCACVQDYTAMAKRQLQALDSAQLQAVFAWSMFPAGFSRSAAKQVMERTLSASSA